APASFGGRRAAPAPAARPATASAGLPAPTERGGHTASKAVEEALAWLAAHQGRAGNWDADGFAAACKESLCPGPGAALYDPGITALATLAFLGAGETHRTPKHGETVAKALKYLKSIQDAEGCFGPRTSSHFTYNHALCTLAMSEAFALTQSPLFQESAQAGVNFALSAQNPYLGWRYGVRPQDNDTSVTSWMVMALRSAKAAGLSVDDAAFEGAIAWFDKVTEPEYGRAGYTARGNGPARPQELMDAFPSDRSESMTAAAVIARLHCGQKPDNEWIRKGIDLVGKTLPAWSDDGGIDFYYWYFGTLASFQVGGDAWTKWNGAVEAALLPHQRGEGDGCARGSFDPVDPWSPEGGRVYSTAVNALTLEVCARYAAAFGGK
ncbi:MAG: terpene cyclase/mutase family protein, partial [Planctomycetes bacterium]|nr:terpene cyclase/mutase family protein [Planctomycetota bacterium]